MKSVAKLAMRRWRCSHEKVMSDEDGDDYQNFDHCRKLWRRMLPASKITRRRVENAIFIEFLTDCNTGFLERNYQKRGS